MTDSSKLAEYRAYLDRLHTALGPKYNLAPLCGAQKQIPWAEDIRIKFIEKLDKNFTRLTEKEIIAIQTHILSNTDSRWWIDNKDISYETLIVNAKLLANDRNHLIDNNMQIQSTMQNLIQNPIQNQMQTHTRIQTQPPQNQTNTNETKPKQTTRNAIPRTQTLQTPQTPQIIQTIQPQTHAQTEGTILINTKDPETITITAPNPAELTDILTKKGFVLDKNIWTKTISKTDINRTPLVEKVTLMLLAHGCTTKILAPEPEDEPHDGIIRIESGALILETKEEHICRAAEKIGTRRIWLNKTSLNDIRNLIEKYDIICTKEAQHMLNTT